MNQAALIRCRVARSMRATLKTRLRRNSSELFRKKSETFLRLECFTRSTEALIVHHAPFSRRRCTQGNGAKHHDRRVEEHGADGRHGFVFWRLGETGFEKSAAIDGRTRLVVRSL
jgi:hypothetical protein